MEFEFLSFLYLVSIFVGVVFISLGPFFRKKPGPWDHRYTALIFVSFVASVIVSFIVYSLNPLEVQDPILVMAAGFTVGLASKPLLEEIWKRFDPDWWTTA